MGIVWSYRFLSAAIHAPPIPARRKRLPQLPKNRCPDLTSNACIRQRLSARIGSANRRRPSYAVDRSIFRVYTELQRSTVSKYAFYRSSSNCPALSRPCCLLTADLLKAVAIIFECCLSIGSVSDVIRRTGCPASSTVLRRKWSVFYFEYIYLCII